MRLSYVDAMRIFGVCRWNFWSFTNSLTGYIFFVYIWHSFLSLSRCVINKSTTFIRLLYFYYCFCVYYHLSYYFNFILIKLKSYATDYKRNYLQSLLILKKGMFYFLKALPYWWLLYCYFTRKFHMNLLTI